MLVHLRNCNTLESCILLMLFLNLLLLNLYKDMVIGTVQTITYVTFIMYMDLKQTHGITNGNKSLIYLKNKKKKGYPSLSQETELNVETLLTQTIQLTGQYLPDKTLETKSFSQEQELITVFQKQQQPLTIILSLLMLEEETDLKELQT